MKLSRTAWNNVIIISVMVMILMINVMNHKLFPNDNSNAINASGEQLVLSAHAVILTLEIPDNFLIERIGQSWGIQSELAIDEPSEQILAQMMKAWQQSAGLLQADGIEISGQTGIEVSINLAGESQEQSLTLYPLVDQLLIKNSQTNHWIALPPQLFRQLLPVEIYPVQPK